MPTSEKQASTPVEELILGPWNETTMELPSRRRVDELFADQARRTPGAVALTFEGRRLCYGELQARVAELGRRITETGVGPGAVIGIYMRRSVEMVVAALAVMRSGNGYLPLDPHYPADRLEYMLEDSGAPLVLTHRELESAPRAAPRVLLVDASQPVAVAGREVEQPRSAEEVDQVDPLCYVIYTSGSTGKPKGVQISHRAAVNFLWSMKGVFAPTPDDVFLAVTTFSFDIAVLELYLPLISGASVALVTEETAQDGAALRDTIRAVGASVVQTTPSRWRLIVGAGLSSSDGIEHALCGGEAFPLDLAEELLPRVGSVWNMYGPTEATVWCSLHRVEPPVATIPIGRPVGNTQLYILNTEDDRLAPVGTPGELYVGGEQLARGYLNRPELTEERFRWFDDFYGRRVRLYRTGDLCRWRADGAVEYLGRVDQQVKLRGFRIELGEIEASLNRHPSVRSSAVTVRDAGKGDQRLVAFLEAPADQRPLLTVGKMRALLAERLPEYMIPSHFAVVERLPLTPNGKVDRKALPELDLGALQLEAEGDYVAPRDELERQLAEIWREELRVKRVGIRDSFLELGGHSLAMVAIATRIREQVGRSIPVPVLASTPTIEALATAIRGGSSLADRRAIDPVDPTDELANRRVLRRALAALVAVGLCAFGAARLFSWPMQAKIIREDPFHTFFASTEQAHRQLARERSPHVVMLGSSSAASDFVPEAFERSFNDRWEPAVADSGQRVRAYNLSLLGATAYVGRVYAGVLRERCYPPGRAGPRLALVEFSPQNATRMGLANFNEEDTQVGHFISAGALLDATEGGSDQEDRSLERLAYRYVMSPVDPKRVTRRVFSRVWREPSWWPVKARPVKTPGRPKTAEERPLLYLQFVGELRGEIGFGEWHPDARNRVDRRYFQGDWIERRWRRFASRDEVLSAARELAADEYGVHEMHLVKEAVDQVVAHVRQARTFAAQVMVVLMPVHPVARLTAAGRRRLQASIDSIRARTGVRVINLFESHDFGPDDFFDVDHLLPGAARRLTRELARRAADRMNHDQAMVASAE